MKHESFLAQNVVVHNCFQAGAKVNLANGSYKNIEDIEIGDVVQVYNEETGTVENEEVTNDILKMRYTYTYEVHFENGIVLRPGDDHAFYTKEKGWANINGLDKIKLNVDQLQIGDQVKHFNDNGSYEWIEVIDIIPIRGEYSTFDLVNMKHETYLVSDFVTHNCFIPGTQITMADGNKKNIEDIEIGEQILSYDPENDIYIPKTVLNSYNGGRVEHSSDACEKLGDPPSIYTINNGLVEFTPEQPFLVRDKNGITKWVALTPNPEKHPQKGKIEDLTLEVGQEILVNDSWVEIKNISISKMNVPDDSVYNLMIEDTHNYIANDIVVHNKTCFMPGTNISMANGSYKNIEEVQIG
jgi:hypothetical protein